MNTELVKLVQSELAKETGLPLNADGDPGQKTIAALHRISQLPAHWDVKRLIVGYLQYRCAKVGINAGPIDGYWGPQTEQAYVRLKMSVLGQSSADVWRHDEGEGTGDTIGGNHWPLQTQSELQAYYGDVGTNQTHVTSPYPLKIAWAPDKVITRFSCHKKVAGSISRVLHQVQEHYGNQIPDLGLDLWGGCLNVRKMRGGTNWSTHSWGIAIDWDPARNKLRQHSDTANFAKPEYDMWWKFWENEGWVSLGRTRNYDWMHVQAAKVRK